MEVKVDPKVLRLINNLEADIPKVVSEALSLWLKEKIPNCPITEDFCVNLQGSCNECSVMNKIDKR